MDEALIAPCGMNCGVCISYLAKKNDLNTHGFKRVYCEGCRPRGKNCLHMGDRCELLRDGLVRYAATTASVCIVRRMYSGRTEDIIGANRNSSYL
jgi:uncharacterized cysteine cluster protein YcgN (CxxCxxCC family)